MLSPEIRSQINTLNSHGLNVIAIEDTIFMVIATIEFPTNERRRLVVSGKDITTSVNAFTFVSISKVASLTLVESVHNSKIECHEYVKYYVFHATN